MEPYTWKKMISQFQNLKSTVQLSEVLSAGKNDAGAPNDRMFPSLGSKGWRSGESARLPPMWLGFEPWRRRYMWVEFVVGSLLCSERFFSEFSGFSGFSGFPLSSKPNSFRNQVDEEPLCGCATSESLFIYLLFIFIKVRWKCSFPMVFFILFKLLWLI